MKKITKILMCLILCVFGVGLVGCKDPRTPEEKAFTYPSENDIVSGNDGMAVQKGNYIYFANGFKAVANSKRYGKFTQGGVMLTKLSETGELVVDETGAIVDENILHISNKLAGFEATSLFIAGDYLYFTSPCQEDNSKTETWAKDWVDFNRIKLDKSSKVERFYTAEINNSEMEFKFYENNGNVSILIYNKTSKKLIKVNTSGKKSTIATKVEDVNFAEAFDKVMFVAGTSDENVPYSSFVLNAISGNKTEIAGHVATAEIVAVGDGVAYVVENNVMSKLNLADGKSSVVLNNYSTYKSVQVVPSENLVVAISTEGSGLIFEYYENGNALPSSYVQDESTTEITVVGMANGSIIYVDSNSNVKSLSYANRNSNAQVETIADVSDMNTTYFDIDGSYMYFYKTVGSNEYLHRLKIDNGEAVEEFVGFYLEADIPETEEE